jgi:iron complex transport system substrate-binding protein
MLLFCSAVARSESNDAVVKEQRIVSLAPSVTEIICEIGAQDVLVGRTTACDYPPTVAHVAVVGKFGKPSSELLIAAKPTLVLYADLIEDGILRRLDELRIPCRRVPYGRLDDIPKAVVAIGECLHREGPAEQLASNLMVRIEGLKRAAPVERPSVFVEIWSDPLMTAGGRSFVAELVRLAGGQNIGDGVEKDYFQVSSEWVVSRSPDIILCVGMGGKSSSSRLVMERAGWKGVKAVQTGRVYDIPHGEKFTRPGPRVLDAIQELQACISRMAEEQ